MITVDYFEILVIIYTLLFIASMAIFNMKVLSPSIIFTASFTVMVYLALFTKDIMGFVVSKKTFEVLTLGGCLFVATEFCVMFYFNILRHRKKVIIRPVTDRKPLYIRKSTLDLFFILINFSFALVIVSIIQSTGGSVGNRMEIYKNMMLYETGTVRYRFLLNQLFKINTAVSYVCAYIGIYNFSMCGENIKKQFKYFAIVCNYIIYSLFSQGARQPAIEIIVFAVLMYFVWNLKKADRHRMIKQICKMIIIAPIAAVIFTKTAVMVGRRNINRKVITYMSTYFCGGLYAFNLHIDEPARNTIWGQASFADVYQFLSKLGIVPKSYVASYHSFELYGNTVTIFGRWYKDFGTIGVCIMTILVSAIFSILFYRYIYPTDRNQTNHLSKMIYGKLVMALVWAGYDDRIRALFSMANIMYLMFIAITYRVFVVEHLRVKIRGAENCFIESSSDRTFLFPLFKVSSRDLIYEVMV